MLYRVASVVVYGVEDEPRITWQVRLCSDVVRLTARPIETGREPIRLPIATSPREWLRGALEQFPEQ